MACLHGKDHGGARARVPNEVARVLALRAGELIVNPQPERASGLPDLGSQGSHATTVDAAKTPDAIERSRADPREPGSADWRSARITPSTGSYLAGNAAEASVRVDNGGAPNGGHAAMVAATALTTQVSRESAGYWQPAAQLP
jgi:hypothetical protein